MPSLEERVQQLEDIEDIRRLKMDYAAHCDNHYDAPKIAALFTEDGVFEAGEFGVHKGRQAVHDLFDPISDDWTFALHYYMGDKIEVTGDTATGTWYFWEPATIKGIAVFNAATYYDEYRKIDGRWYFTLQKIDFKFLTPYEDGWVKTPFADL